MIRISVLNNRLTEATVTAFKTFLTDINPYLIAVLTTPIEEDFTPEQLQELRITPNYCNLTVESNIEPLAIKVPYAEMEV